MGITASRRHALAGGAALVGACAFGRGAQSAGGEATVPLDLVAAERLVAVPGAGFGPVPMWTYAAGGAPVVRVRKGDRVRATLTNLLPQHTAIHWHGLRVPHAMDGVPYVTQPPVLPGESWGYDFVAEDAGTYFFHPHCNTVEQLGRGLAGVLVVEGDAVEPFDADLVLAMRDFRLDAAGRFQPFLTEAGAGRAGSFGAVRTVNGACRPTVAIPAGGDVRLRILNIDPTRVSELGLEGAEAALIAVDGNGLPPAPLRSWRAGPATRIDLALRAPATPGAVVRLLDYFAPEPVELARLVAAGEPVRRRTFAPAPLLPNALAEPDLERAERLRLNFAASAVAQEIMLPDGQSLRLADGLCLADRTFWAINRRSWPTDGHGQLPPPLFEAARGRTQLLELVNATPHQHPIHLHGHFFKVLKGRKGTPLHWADTILLGPKDRAQIAFVADRPGDWMLHCHVIEHQETGMMGIYRVA